MQDRRDIYQVIKDTIRIEEFAKELGYTIVRKGRYYSLKEHDSVIIDPDKNCFWQNSMPGRGNAIGIGGSVIDFAIILGNMTKAEALMLLEKKAVYFSREKQVQYEKKPKYQNHRESKVLRLPGKDNNMRKVFAYLTKTRGIAPEIVQEMVKRRQLYQDIHGNCVFISYDTDGTAVYGCRRGTNTEVPFYGDLSGSDYSKCFYFRNHAAEKIIVTESVIDAMSFMTLHKDAYTEWNYLALGGSGKWKAILSYIENPKIKEIWIGTDNDKSGWTAGVLIKKTVKKIRTDMKIECKIPKENDWNKVLTEGRKVK